VLAYAPLGGVTWTWLYADPDSFQLDESPDGVSGWSNYSGYGGSIRAAGGLDVPAFYRVWAADSLGNQISEFSNVVNVPA
jgi:hypothetical protein